MAKDVLIEITGAHAMDEESQNISAVMRGRLSQKNGKYFLIYEEVSPENPVPVKNTLICSPGQVELIRSGEFRTRMVFEPRQNTVSLYSTPFGNITLTIYTEAIRLTDQEDSFLVEVDYLLGSGGQTLSSCCLTVRAVPAGAQALSFLEQSFGGTREKPSR